ncbi:hypothetical protein [Streptomyces crystallinus]|uniref:Uncharacterized protein n=1 Tax=Streptomyces crystallinus TaxID=68191 RepID=A0ABN1GK75_9ACTN
MPAPIPVTDDQLRRWATERVDRWIDDTESRLRMAAEPTQMPPQALAGIPDRRRPKWRDLVQQLARTGADAFRKAAAQRRPDIAAQAFALLRAAEPRLTDRDMAQPSAAVKTMLDGLAAQTEAGAALAALATASYATVAELLERAPLFDDLRAAKTVELGYVRDSLLNLIAPFSQAQAAVTGSSARKLLPLLVEETAVGAAARAAVPDLARVEHDCDLALRNSLGMSLGEQYRALVGPLNAARTAAQTAMDRLAPASAAYGAMLAAFRDRWIDSHWDRPYSALDKLFDFYGLTALRAVLAISPQQARKVAYQLDPPYDRLRPDDPAIELVPDFCRIFPRNTTENVLIWAFNELTNTTEEPGAWLRSLEHQLTGNPATTPWPPELGPPAPPDN